MTVTVRSDAGGTFGSLLVGGVDVLKFGTGAAGDALEVAKVPDIASKLNASGSAPMYACRAWVNFNGTGTVAIRASGNVSSITDNGTGNYTVNLTTALPDANFAVSALGKRPATNHGGGAVLPFDVFQTANTVPIRFYGSDWATAVDPDLLALSVFR